MPSYSQVIDENTPIENVIDYSNSTTNGNNVKNQISDLNQKIVTYLDEVERVIEQENSYALNSESLKVCGIDVTKEPVQKIYDAKVQLVKDWKKIKKKMKRSALEERVRVLGKIYSACSAKMSPASGWGVMNDEDKKLDKKRKEALKEKEKAQKKLDNM